MIVYYVVHEQSRIACYHVELAVACMYVSKNPHKQAHQHRVKASTSYTEDMTANLVLYGSRMTL